MFVEVVYLLAGEEDAAEDGEGGQDRQQEHDGGDVSGEESDEDGGDAFAALPVADGAFVDEVFGAGLDVAGGLGVDQGDHGEGGEGGVVSEIGLAQVID